MFNKFHLDDLKLVERVSDTTLFGGMIKENHV